MERDQRDRIHWKDQNSEINFTASHAAVVDLCLCIKSGDKILSILLNARATSTMSKIGGPRSGAVPRGIPAIGTSNAPTGSLDTWPNPLATGPKELMNRPDTLARRLVEVLGHTQHSSRIDLCRNRGGTEYLGRDYNDSGST